MSEEHLARFGALYEEWGMYMSDDRPRRRPARDLAVGSRRRVSTSTASSPRWRRWRRRQRDVIGAVGADVFAAEIAEECFVDALQVRCDTGAR